LARLNVIRPAERYGHGRFFAGRDRQRPEIFVPAGKRHVIPLGSQLGQEPRQVEHAGAFAAGGVQGKGQMVAVSEDRLDQAGKTGTGANLDEGADPGGIHGLDLGDKLHRAGQLSGQQLPGGGRLRRVNGSAAVGIDRYDPCGKGDIVQGGQERYGRIGHQRAVKSGCHRQLLAGETPGGKQCGGAVDLGAAAGENRLIRGVTVGDHQVEPFFGEDLLDGRQRCGNGQHAPPVACAFGHQLAAETGK